MMKLAVGEIVQGYRIDRFLGRGGFASVYLAVDQRTEEKVALKLGHVAGGGRQVTRLLEVTPRRTPDGISPDELPAEAVFLDPQGVRIDLFDQHEIARMLQSEAEILARTDGNGFVRLRDQFVDDGRHFLVLDYIRGRTLREKIRGLEGIHLNWFLAIVRHLIRMRDEGVVAFHGDLKPENVIVKPSGKVVMIDPSLRDDRMMTTTPHYNPLILDSEKADVMAIGIMIYEILTGTLPFDEVPWEFARQGGGGEMHRLSLSFFFSYCPPLTLNAKTPPELERIVYRCITVPDYELDELRCDLEDFIGRS